jgi:formiminoglutamase
MPMPLLPADFSLWQGRVDAEEMTRPGANLRVHQIVRAAAAAPAIALPAIALPATALIGFACDAGVRRNQGRVGAAAGPDAIRKALANLAWPVPKFSSSAERDRTKYERSRELIDLGNVFCADDALETAQQELAVVVTQALNAGHFPIVLGGGHEVAFASWSGLAGYLRTKSQVARSAVDQHESTTNTAPRIGVVNFDAHFDLRHAAAANSGTPFAQIAAASAELGWPFCYQVFGISPASNTQVLFDRADALGVRYVLDRACQARDLPSLSAALTTWIAGCDVIYLTICMDVFPASVAPGVSAPAAFGVEVDVVMQLIDVIAQSGKLRLVDIAETNPSFDIDQRTAKLAARLIWNVLQQI